ncbi:MAG TPA: pirin family protein [Polyangiaceae bacterium]|jgi:hypothetical protein
MLTVRRALERGHFRYDWLDTYHSFSFSDYYDPAHMGFRALRVINEDRISPGSGFGMHPHRDMEIITYVLEGALEHRDSMGNGSVIRPGEVQQMSAGTGVRHSEYNASKTDPVHLLQIWVVPNVLGVPPSYAQKEFGIESRRSKLCLLASPDGQGGSIKIHADARLYATHLERGERVEHLVRPDSGTWIQVAKGKLQVAGTELAPGDGASTSDAGSLMLETDESAELLLFDLA